MRKHTKNTCTEEWPKKKTTLKFWCKGYESIVSEIKHKVLADQSRAGAVSKHMRNDVKFHAQIH